MGKNMKAIFVIFSSMAKEPKYFQMVITIKDNLEKENLKVQGFINGEVE